MPVLQKLREHYLNTNELKLRLLKRKNKSTQEGEREALDFWRDLTNIEQISSISPS